MSTKQATVDFILDQLSRVPNIRVRKMFGEYALYCNEKVIGLVCDDELFIKITNEGKRFANEDYKEGIPYPGAKPYMKIDEKLDDSNWLEELVLTTANALPSPKLRKKKT